MSDFLRVWWVRVYWIDGAGWGFLNLRLEERATLCLRKHVSLLNSLSGHNFAPKLFSWNSSLSFKQMQQKTPELKCNEFFWVSTEFCPSLGHLEIGKLRISHVIFLRFGKGNASSLVGRMPSWSTPRNAGNSGEHCTPDTIIAHRNVSSWNAHNPVACSHDPWNYMQRPL